MASIGAIVDEWSLPTMLDTLALERVLYRLVTPDVASRLSEHRENVRAIVQRNDAGRALRALAAYRRQWLDTTFVAVRARDRSLTRAPTPFVTAWRIAMPCGGATFDVRDSSLIVESIALTLALVVALVRAAFRECAAGADRVQRVRGALGALRELVERFVDVAPFVVVVVSSAAASSSKTTGATTSFAKSTASSSSIAMSTSNAALHSAAFGGAVRPTIGEALAQQVGVRTSRLASATFIDGVAAFVCALVSAARAECIDDSDALVAAYNFDALRHARRAAARWPDIDRRLEHALAVRAYTALARAIRRDATRFEFAMGVAVACAREARSLVTASPHTASQVNAHSINAHLINDDDESTSVESFAEELEHDNRFVYGAHAVPRVRDIVMCEHDSLELDIERTDDGRFRVAVPNVNEL